MRRLALLLLLASPLAVRAQMLQTVANNQPSVALTPKAAGDTLLVECNYAAAPAGKVSDSRSTAFTAVGPANAANGIAQIVAISAPLAAAAADTVTCPAGTGFGEIYVVELAGSNAVDGKAIEATGSASPASASVPSNPGDLLVAFVVTGTATNAAGWTAASQFDDNLVAYVIPSASPMLASFKTTAAWAMTVVPVQHIATASNAFQVTIPGLATFLFPLTSFSQVPACNASDGACSLQLEVCDAAAPPHCTIMSGGKVYILKNVSLPAPATQQTTILAVTSP